MGGPARAERTRRFRAWAVSVLPPALPGLVGLVLAWASYGGRLIDDAYITLTYARQLALGNGLVFHPDLPLTEGYSDLLWALVLAVFVRLGIPGSWAAMVLGLLLSGLALGWVAARIGGLRGASVGVAIAVSPIYGYWAGAGLEGGLFSLLLLIAVLGLGTTPSWVAFGLLGVTRVEGVAYGAVGLVHAVFARRWPTLRQMGAWLGPVGVQLILRKLYYGELVPSPVRAKVSGDVSRAFSNGFSWLSGLAVVEPVLSAAVVVAGIALLVRFARRRALDTLSPWALFVILGITAFGLAVGGDWMPNLRFFQPAVLLGWLAVAALLPRGPWLPLLALLSVGVGARVGVVERGGRSNPRDLAVLEETLHSGPMPAPLHAAHLFVLEYLDPDEAVLMPDVGKLAWITGNPVLDPQGLTWRAVAEALRAGWSSKKGGRSIEQIRSTVLASRPALVALLVHEDTELPSGPVSVALLGINGRDPLDWFDENWTFWGERPYGKSGVLRYYLRNDLGAPPSPEARVARYREALRRAPEVAFLWVRLSQTLYDLGDRAGADEAASHIDPRARTMMEIWTR